MQARKARPASTWQHSVAMQRFCDMAPIVGEVLPPEAILLTGAVELIDPGLMWAWLCSAMLAIASTPSWPAPLLPRVVRRWNGSVSILKTATPRPAGWCGLPSTISRGVAAIACALPRKPPNSLRGFRTTQSCTCWRTLPRDLAATDRCYRRGRIRGLAGVFGCPNPNTAASQAQVRTVEELIQRDILVLQTGGSAIACAKRDYSCPRLPPKPARACAEICEAVASRLCCTWAPTWTTPAFSWLPAQCSEKPGGGLADLPLAMAAPEWTGEEAVAAAHCFVASGFYVVLGHRLYTDGSDDVSRIFGVEMEDLTGGRIDCEPDPAVAADKILDLSNTSAMRLRMNVRKERKLFDMKSRRELQ